MGVASVIGCLLGGWGADRFGRPPAAVAALAVSGLCCLLSPLAFRANPTLLMIFCAIWGAAVIADSGVFSTLLSELADTRFVGTALTAQTAIGFGLTTVSIQLVPVLADTASWQYGFLLLAPGPALGVLAMSAISLQPTLTTTASTQPQTNPTEYPRLTASPSAAEASVPSVHPSAVTGVERATGRSVVVRPPFD